MEEALESYDRAIELNPNMPELQWERAGVLLQMGRVEEAGEGFESWLRLEGFERPELIRRVLDGILDPGSREAARDALGALEAEGRIRPIFWVQLWADLGEMDHAIELLEEAYASGDPNIILFGVDPRWARVRSDPRAVRILEELDLPIGVPEG